MILHRLREQTKAYHDSLEEKLDIFNRCRSVEAYRLLLGRFLGFYRPVEARLGSRGDWRTLRFDFEERRKTGLLRRDLKALGVLDPHADALPLCTDLPDLHTLPQALGCLYVLEGATLGGQIISRHVKQQLGLDAETGCAFFRSYGGHVGAMWKTFGAMLTAHASAPEVQEAVIGSARDTFIKMDRWLGGGNGQT